MPNEYEGMSYKEIRAECKEKNINAKGSRDELIDRLTEARIAEKSGIEKAEGAKPAQKATDPDPENPNFDMAGRWRRRPMGFLHWREDGTACCAGDEDDPNREV